MHLFEARAEVPFDAVDAIDERLLEWGDERWSVLQDVITRRAWVLGIFRSESDAAESWSAVRGQLSGAGDVGIRPLAEADWRESYKAHFHAWRCGRLHWVPVWERDRHALGPGEVALWLDPGLAFGTGNHETTRLCCERLVHWAEGRSPTARVIDAGCGSGILALSAARLGFETVRGFDNDPEAVRVSRENAALNGLAHRVTFTADDLRSGLTGAQAELVLANIQADVLMRYAAVLLQAIAPGGLLALSGILAAERDQVRDAFARLAPGWSIDSRVLGEWCDVALTRP